MLGLEATHLSGLGKCHPLLTTFSLLEMKGV